MGFVSSLGFLSTFLPCSASFWGKILVIWFLYILKFYVRYIFYGSGFVPPVWDYGLDKLLNRECCCRNMGRQIWLDFRSCYAMHCRNTLNNGKREAHCFRFFEMHRWWDEGVLTMSVFVFCYNKIVFEFIPWTCESSMVQVPYLEFVLLSIR